MYIMAASLLDPTPFYSANNKYLTLFDFVSPQC